GAQGEGADHHGGEQHVPHQVAPGEEHRGGQGEHDHDEDQAGEGEQLLQSGPQVPGHPGGGPLVRLVLTGGRGAHSGPASLITLGSESGRSVASSMMFSWVARSWSSTPLTRPSLITTTRWAMRSTSGSSEEIMMIDLPAAASWFSR